MLGVWCTASRDIRILETIDDQVGEHLAAIIYSKLCTSSQRLAVVSSSLASNPRAGPWPPINHYLFFISLQQVLFQSIIQLQIYLHCGSRCNSRCFRGLILSRIGRKIFPADESVRFWSCRQLSTEECNRYLIRRPGIR